MFSEVIIFFLFQMRHLYLVVDLSQAMEGQDLKPSRLSLTLKVFLLCLNKCWSTFYFYQYHNKSIKCDTIEPITLRHQSFMCYNLTGRFYRNCSYFHHALLVGITNFVYRVSGCFMLWLSTICKKLSKI